MRAKLGQTTLNEKSLFTPPAYELCLSCQHFILIFIRRRNKIPVFPSSINKKGWMENAECGVWKMRSMESAECGKCGVWKMRSVENAEYGKCGVCGNA